MAKMKPGQISAKRAYEMSDSLKSKAQYQAGAMDFAANRLKSAKTPVEKKQAGSILEGLSRSSEYNYQKSDRLKSRADQAMNNANAKSKAINTGVDIAKGKVDRNASVLGLGSGFLGKNNMSYFEESGKSHKKELAKANAAAGRDTPLPSSEGLFSKIKNIFN